MATVDNLKSDIDLINTFSNEFFSKTNLVNSKISLTNQNIDDVINEEKKNELYLSNLEKKISKDELNNLLNLFKNQNESISKKYLDYSSLIENNSKQIVTICNTIKTNKDLINELYNVLEELENNTSTIQNKIKK